MEAEYVALNATVKEAIFLKQFLAELQIVECVQKPIPIFCDNNSAIVISKDPRWHSHAKQNLADPFTRDMSSRLFETHVLGFRLC